MTASQKTTLGDLAWLFLKIGTIGVYRSGNRRARARQCRPADPVQDQFPWLVLGGAIVGLISYVSGA